MPNRKKNSPVITTDTTTAAAMARIMNVEPLSRIEPIRRPGCICTTDSGSASFGSSSGASSSLARCAITPEPGMTCAPAAGAAGDACCEPDARRRISRRSASACAEPRYASGTFASCPATLISSFAAPNSRAKNGRMMLMPWMRSSRPRRCVRNTTPLFTSTSSSVMRNVCMRHETVKNASASSSPPMMAPIAGST